MQRILELLLISALSVTAGFFGYRSYTLDRTLQVRDSVWESEYVELADKWARCRAKVVMDTLYYETDTTFIERVEDSDD